MAVFVVVLAVFSAVFVVVFAVFSAVFVVVFAVFRVNLCVSESGTLEN